MNIVTPETIAKTHADRAAYFNGLEEKEVEYGTDYIYELINPSEIRIGDCMMQEGCIFEVTQVEVFEQKDDIPCYVVTGLYVAGSLSMYKWFLRDMQNGCAKSHYTSKQGNARASWPRVTFINDQQKRDAEYRQKWQDIYDNDMQDLY